MNFNFSHFNWHDYLIDNYKEFGILENELVIILMIDNLNKMEHFLVTKSDLSLKMNISIDDIDESLSHLYSMGFLTYVEEHGITVTSLKPLLQRIESTMRESIVHKEIVKNDEEQQGEIANSLKFYEVIIGRSLTPIEIDYVYQWINIGYAENMIKEAIQLVSEHAKTITARAIDKMLLKISKSQDVKSEGFTAQNEKWKKSVTETIAMVNYDWTKDEHK